MDEITTAANEQDFAEPDMNESEESTTLQAETPEDTGSSEPVKPELTETQAFAKRLKEEKQKERDAMIAEMYGESHGFQTEAEYRQALAEQAAEEKGLTPEEYEALQIGMTQKQKAQQRQDDINEIVQLSAKEGFDPTQLPQEVLMKWEAGEGRLVDLYKEHQGQIKEKTVAETISAKDKRIAELEKALGIQKINEENSQAAAGSVGGNGVAGTGFISKEQFDNNKSNQSWVIKNLSKISESRKKW